MATAISLRSRSVSSIDVLRSGNAPLSLQLVSVIGFALLTAVGAQVRIYLWEVPFTLQTVAVYGSGLFLGWRNGLLAQVLYLALGLFLPVFAGDGYGAAYILAAASGGYLMAFPVVAALVGRISVSWNGAIGSVVCLIVGSIALFSLGTVWLHYAAGHATWVESFDKGWFRFIPADLAKILFVVLVYGGLRRLGRS